jgi:hypothetical protein
MAGDRQLMKGVHIENLFHLLIFSMDFFFKVFIICIMKKVIFLLIIAFFLAGCTAEWYKHDTIYKTNDHMTFSMWGYKNPTNDDLQKSESEGWWGEEVPYIPAE